MALREGARTLSIIIPCYNAGKKIERAIDSCLQFSDFSVEVVVVNDASTDDTELKLKRYESDHRVKVISFEKNRGASSARNQGISTAQGEFVLFLDADDYFLKTASSEISSSLESNPEVDVYCFGYVINDRKSPKPDSDALYLEFMRKKFSNTNTILTRRVALAGHVFEEKYRIGEDTLFWFKLLLQKRSAYFEKYVAYYDYVPKLNLVDRHPMLEIDLEAMGVSRESAEEIRSALEKNTNMKKAFGRVDSLGTVFKKMGIRGLVFWVIGPSLFGLLWTLKHKARI